MKASLKSQATGAARCGGVSPLIYLYVWLKNQLTMNNLTQYLAEMKAELQELYEDLDSELRLTDNQNLIDDTYRNVTSKLESALSEMETLIGDIDSGVYDDNITDYNDDGMLEDEE